MLRNKRSRWKSNFLHVEYMYNTSSIIVWNDQIRYSNAKRCNTRGIYDFSICTRYHKVLCMRWTCCRISYIDKETVSDRTSIPVWLFFFCFIFLSGFFWRFIVQNCILKFFINCFCIFYLMAFISIRFLFYFREIKVRIIHRTMIKLNRG